MNINNLSWKFNENIMTKDNKNQSTEILIYIQTFHNFWAVNIKLIYKSFECIKKLNILKYPACVTNKINFIYFLDNIYTITEIYSKY